MAKPFLYLASPLFSSAERAFNEELATRLGAVFTVYLPQRDGGLFVDLVRNQGISAEAAARRIFALDIKAIRASDVVLAVLDGRAVDEGVALEVGYAYAIGRPCFGLQTDLRRLLPEGNNPMLTAALRKVEFGLDRLELLVDEMKQSVRYQPTPHPRDESQEK